MDLKQCFPTMCLLIKPKACSVSENVSAYGVLGGFYGLPSEFSNGTFGEPKYTTEDTHSLAVSN